MKQQVIDFLKNLPLDAYEQYNKAFDFYRKSGNSDMSSERTYNQGYTETNLKNIKYDLQKAYVISDLELLEDAKPTKQVVNEPTTLEKLGEATTRYEEFKKTYSEKLAEETPDEDVLKTLSISIEGLEKQIAELTELLDQEAKAINVNGEEVLSGNKENDFNTPAPTTSERVAMRDDFPFLKEKDCPIELKALVADKMTAFEEYCKGHNDLVKHSNGELVLTDEEFQALTKKTVAAYEENRGIYDELNYYKAHGKVLGKHPLFSQLSLEREVNAMSQEELLSFRDSSPKFKSTKKREAEQNSKDPVKLAKIEASVKNRTEKLALVNKRLGV